MHARIARRLRQLRAARQWTQAQTAQALGVNKYTYSAYERCLRLPPTGRLAQLAALYGISLSALLSEAANDDLAPQAQKG